MSVKIFKCSVCGKIIILLNNESIPTVCCNETMKELIAGIRDWRRRFHWRHRKRKVPTYEIILI